MQANELEQVVRGIVATAELLGYPITPTAAALLASDLECYQPVHIGAALRRVRGEHQGRLTLKAIQDRLDDAMGRLAPNEAWALAVQAIDERNTVVWTDEIEAAWGVAKGLALGGDKIGARMAFLSSYERIARDGRAQQRTPQMRISRGWDKDLFRMAITQAANVGLLPVERAATELASLPAPENAAFDSMALLGGEVKLLPSANVEPLPEPLRQRWRAFGADLKAKLAKRSEERRNAADVERDRVDQLKADTAARVDEYAKKG